MMKHNSYAYKLLLKQHYGKLTPEEEKELNALLEKNQHLISVQKEIQKIPFDEAQRFTSSLNVNSALSDVYQRAAALRKRRMLRTTVMATASAAAFIAVLFFIQYNSGSSSNDEFVVMENPNATLVLADGKVIPMQDSGIQQLVAGNLPVVNSNRSLSFLEASRSHTADKGLNTLTVPTKLDFQIELSDGTKVWLNSTTEFRFPFEFGSEKREVYIDRGEAFFEIAQDANKPFTVHTAAGPVRVLGTTFNINAYTPGKVITSLVSGKVAVTVGEKTMELQPGSEAVVENGQLRKNLEFDAVNTLSWREGVHYFNNASIEEVGVMLKRWFNIQLIIDNPQVARTEIRGKLFRNEPLDKFFRQVNNTNVVTFYWKNNELHCK